MVTSKYYKTINDYSHAISSNTLPRLLFNTLNTITNKELKENYSLIWNTCDSIYNIRMCRLITRYWTFKTLINGTGYSKVEVLTSVLTLNSFIYSIYTMEEYFNVKSSIHDMLRPLIVRQLNEMLSRIYITFYISHILKSVPLKNKPELYSKCD